MLAPRIGQMALLCSLLSVALVCGEELTPKEKEAGFVSLFNGKNLDGWVGSVEGYTVEDGAIVCIPDKGGNLFTDKEYADFELRFDFKLAPNANNGLGLRAPLEGNAAYVGMESQILDDSGDQYKTLQPYQYHGSIYGVLPCKRGHQKPVGEWNSQTVICNGRDVKVILNGVTIVEGNLDKASDPKTIDGQDHPGLKRTTGHIGFLGHGTRIDVKNIRLKDLAKK